MVLDLADEFDEKQWAAIDSTACKIERGGRVAMIDAYLIAIFFQLPRPR
jgi:hypothetical protein